VHHFGAGVSLLIIVGERHGIEFAHGYRLAARHSILPGNRGARLDLGPRNLGVLSAAKTALGDEIIDAAPALFVTRIPVLDVEYLISAPSSAMSSTTAAWSWFSSRIGAVHPFEIADVRSFLGDDERSLELAGIGRIDSEVSGQFHRTSNAFSGCNKRNRR